MNRSLSALAIFSGVPGSLTAGNAAPQARATFGEVFDRSLAKEEGRMPLVTTP